MATPYLGQISMFGGNFAPRGWALCNGQILNIAQNTALFSLLGTYFGGNGIQTFGLPNLISRLPVHIGQGLGLSPYVIGQIGGNPEVTITTPTMPSHIHVLNATKTAATSATIANNLLPGTPTNSRDFYAKPVAGQPAPTQAPFASAVCGMSGGNQPHTNLMPSLCITFIIALQGVYPTRS
ncbi:MAG TPA: tail fiber protein [Gemmataceae bacterium]|nr:tail fiber protein [Gemmataceae bacterium]HTZ03453.1 tail fiber protein [Xanthobacteraceae bacterium]